MQFKQQYTGQLTTTFIWLIPPLLMVSRSVIDPGAVVYALHITPFFEIGFNWRNRKKEA